MSKYDDLKAQAKKNTESLISGFIAPQQTADETPKKEIKKDIKPIEKGNASDDVKKTFDEKSGNYNKKHNYTITFKIDEDLKDYFKNIEKITFIESIKSGKVNSTTKTEYVNNYIREQYYKLIGASVKDDANTINAKWLKYKEDNNL